MTEHAVGLDVNGLEAWSTGAPRPVVLMSEERALIAYYVSGVPVDDGVGTAEFVDCLSLRMGSPNDEALGGHPLYGRGLEAYRLHEVVDSRWLSELRAIESAHPLAPAVPFEACRHFILTFHDSTVEAIAATIEPGPTYPTMADAIGAHAARLRL